MKALNRNNKIDVSNFPTERSFDASTLKNNFDVILLWSNNEWGMPDELKNIEPRYSSYCQSSRCW